MDVPFNWKSVQISSYQFKSVQNQLLRKEGGTHASMQTCTVGFWAKVETNKGHGHHCWKEHSPVIKLIDPYQFKSVQISSYQFISVAQKRGLHSCKHADVYGWLLSKDWYKQKTWAPLLKGVSTYHPTGWPISVQISSESVAQKKKAGHVNAKINKKALTQTLWCWLYDV